MRDRHVSQESIEKRAGSFYKGCVSKKRFNSKRSALGVKRVMNDEGLQAYKCKLCKAWHLGHDNRGVSHTQ
jgi:hypothetical protein